MEGIATQYRRVRTLQQEERISTRKDNNKEIVKKLNHDRSE